MAPTLAFFSRSSTSDFVRSTDNSTLVNVNVVNF